MGTLSRLVRKAGRTAQVHMPLLQDAGKSAEAVLRRLSGKLHDADLNGLRFIDIPKSALFLDIGANRGSAAQSFWTLAPSCRIVCFEPNALLAQRFLGTVKRRGGTVHVVALGDEPGNFPLFVPIYKGVMFDGLASLNRSDAEHWLNSETLFGFNPLKLEISEQLCEVKRLDDFDYEPFFIKIDVQGREAAVIRGGMKTIERVLPIIFAESETLELDAVAPLLAQLGYAFYRFDGSSFQRGARSTSNIYFIPEAKLALVRSGHMQV